ncbi:hypothetical protein OV450_1698 [Actinobacteria bacterium OV450]|nr:hypothetical protein OV450_1698 [Actinobacteria bacterium OV450]
MGALCSQFEDTPACAAAESGRSDFVVSCEIVGPHPRQPLRVCAIILIALLVQ